MIVLPATRTKATVTARYIAALERLHLNRRHVKKRVTLETARSHTNIAWGWTIKALREQGGRIVSDKTELEVPKDVHVSVVYASSDDADVTEEALDVFNDSQLNAKTATVEDVGEHAKFAAQLVRHQADFGLG